MSIFICYDAALAVGSIVYNVFEVQHRYDDSKCVYNVRNWASASLAVFFLNQCFFFAYAFPNRMMLPLFILQSALVNPIILIFNIYGSAIIHNCGPSCIYDGWFYAYLLLCNIQLYFLFIGM